ncbi:MAG: DUF4845 domain-containing protein [Paucibacter sp.]|nr:DUF4845 domain-containing protein [Roseateles sp.]
MPIRQPAVQCSERRLGKQRGVSLFGLLFWAILLAFVGVVAAKTFPTVLEYVTIKRVIHKIALDNPGTVPAVRAEFEKARQVEYSISSIASEDLVVTKENDKLVISFAYDRQIELFGPVFLLIKYEGNSN